VVLTGALLLLLLIGGAGLLLSRGDRGESGVEVSQPIGDQVDLELPPAEAITLGSEPVRIQGEIRSPGQLDAYSFTAEAGQAIFVWTARFDDGMSLIGLRLLDADGDELQTTCLGCGNMGSQVLRAGGNYTLVVGSDNTAAEGAYELRLSLVPPPAVYDAALDLRIAENQPVPGANQITVPGAIQQFRFTVEAGQLIFVETAAFDDGMSQIMVRLLDADGDELVTTCLGCGNLGTQLLRDGGSYTLAVGSDVDPATGAFDLRVSAVPPPAVEEVALPFRVNEGLIERPGAIEVYRFEAAAGEQIYVRTIDFDVTMSQILVRVLDANGDEVDSTCLGCGDLGTLTLRTGGSYTLEVGSSSDASTGAYALEVTTP
jgi:RNase P subunit RPR2